MFLFGEFDDQVSFYSRSSVKPDTKTALQLTNYFNSREELKLNYLRQFITLNPKSRKMGILSFSEDLDGRNAAGSVQLTSNTISNWFSEKKIVFPTFNWLNPIEKESVVIFQDIKSGAPEPTHISNHSEPIGLVELSQLINIVQPIPLTCMDPIPSEEGPKKSKDEPKEPNDKGMRIKVNHKPSNLLRLFNKFDPFNQGSTESGQIENSCFSPKSHRPTIGDIATIESEMEKVKASPDLRNHLSLGRFFTRTDSSKPNRRDLSLRVHFRSPITSPDKREPVIISVSSVSSEMSLVS